MRRAFTVTSASFALSAAVACATSEDRAPLSPPNDPDPTVLQEAGAPEDAPIDTSPPVVPTCSTAGWCMTTLPDGDLTLMDIWPFESRAFAIAESPTLGVKVLEWDEKAHSWSYIDDNSQNTFESDAYAGKIWAPSENELYFGVGPAFIYHGKRAAPGSPWTWQRSQLEDNSADGHPERDHGRIEYWNPNWDPVRVTALGVWGTSADDVYAWYSNTIFHWKSVDGGAPSWVPEHVIEDPDTPEDSFFVFAAGGSSADDVWFAGGRGRFDWHLYRCPMVIHRAGGTYDRLVDNVIGTADDYTHYYNTCIEKEDVLGFSWANDRGTMHWGDGGFFTNIQSAGPGRVVGIVGGELFAYVESGEAPLARVNRVVAQVPRDFPPSVVNSVWIQGAKAYLSGWGVVLETPNDPAKWSTGFGLLSEDGAHSLGLDAPTYAFSPTAINGSPLDKPLYQVRGTSNTNLWAIGLQNALHKTTP